MDGDAATGGYRLVAADGGVFCFGAPFAGSAVGLVGRAVVSVDSPGGGYRIVWPTGPSTTSAAPPTWARSTCRRWSAKW